MYNLFLQKFLIKVSLVQASLIQTFTERGSAEASPACFRASQIRIINMASEQPPFTHPSTWKTLCSDIMFYVFTTENLLLRWQSPQTKGSRECVTSQYEGKNPKYN